MPRPAMQLEAGAQRIQRYERPSSAATLAVPHSRTDRRCGGGGVGGAGRTVVPRTPTTCKRARGRNPASSFDRSRPARVAGCRNHLILLSNAVSSCGSSSPGRGCATSLDTRHGQRRNDRLRRHRSCSRASRGPARRWRPRCLRRRRLRPELCARRPRRGRAKYIGETEKNLDRIFDAADRRQRRIAVPRRGRRDLLGKRTEDQRFATPTTATPTSRLQHTCSSASSDLTARQC